MQPKNADMSQLKAINDNQMIINEGNKISHRRPGLSLFDKPEHHPVFGPEYRPSESEYQIALSKIKELSLQKDNHPQITPHLYDLIVHIEYLKASSKAPVQDLVTALTQTYDLLTGTLDPKSYAKTAKTMEGHPSTGMAWAGAIMLTLGLAWSTLTTIVLPFVALTGVGLPFAVAYGMFQYTFGSTLMLGGYGLIKDSGAKGLSKNMLDVAKAKIDETESYSPIMANN